MKNNKRKKNKVDKTTAEPNEEQKQEEILQALDAFIKEKEPEVKQQEKESEELKKLKKKLNEKLAEIEKIKSQNRNEEIYDLLVKTV